MSDYITLAKLKKTPEFKRALKLEVQNLKKYITEEERNLLIEAWKKGKIDSGDVKGCIYGHLTGHCYSIRAEQLIEKCCIYIVDYPEVTEENNYFKETRILGISDARTPWPNSHWKQREYFSPIEAAISIEDDTREPNDFKFIDSILKFLENPKTVRYVVPRD